MLLNKEYPATHSMSTSWYGIDSDGNVAIFEFDENGPVPQLTEQEGIEGILGWKFVEELSSGMKSLTLTEAQANEVIVHLNDFVSVEQIKYTSSIVKIKSGRIEEFEQKVSEIREAKKYNCFAPNILYLNRTLGLLVVSLDGVYNHVLEEILASGIIEKVRCFEFDNENQWDEVTKSVKYSHECAGMPFYLYQQPYWPQYLTERTYVPAYPLKEEQLNPLARALALRFDRSFSEIDKLQIAAYFPYDAELDQQAIDSDGEAFWLPVNNNEEALIKVSEIPGTVNLGVEIIEVSSVCPTIVVVMVGEQEDYMWKWKTHVYKSSLCVMRVYQKQHLTERRIIDLINHVNPYVIIVYDDLTDFFEASFAYTDKKAVINGQCYPVLLESEVDGNMAYLDEQSLRPYRGKRVNRIVATRKIKKDD